VIERIKKSARVENEESKHSDDFDFSIGNLNLDILDDLVAVPKVSHLIPPEKAAGVKNSEQAKSSCGLLAEL